MILAAHAQACEAGTIQLWVGMFGTQDPPAPAFFIREAAAVPLDPSPMTPIRDRHVGTDGKPINHRGIFRFSVAPNEDLYAVRIVAGGEIYELKVRTLPQALPSTLDGEFNILLCSCYFQPEDRNGLLGTIASQIKLKPHLTLMAGDQVYLDLPLLEDMPQSEPALSQLVGDKYMRNWASASLNTAGLEPVLAKAPVVAIADDHEFWNNYPFPQAQLPNTWSDEVRGRWKAAAQALYEDYQLACDPTAAGVTRLDVLPLRMLFVDMRANRDDSFHRLMNPAAESAFKSWVDDLIQDKIAGAPAVGVLASGQALFIDSPTSDFKKRTADAEMGNYQQFDLVKSELVRLADEGVPLLYLTGDVHWSRVASAKDRQHPGMPLFYEVISSPSCLIRTPVIDAAKESINAVKGIFGAKSPWPRHSDPAEVPDYFGPANRFSLRSEFKRAGDRIAFVSFARAGNGVDVRVTYYAISPDKKLSRSETVKTLELRPV
ncbi:alkaline phosphatase D family protein [Variovorax sp. W2I14]|uniref:alkaline phosphatase D family protein n=1 Tax=Variovorax sp. W2I14 TaxID=3042290 RepID=UPI003D1E4DAB